jgi:hypothetical protein
MRRSNCQTARRGRSFVESPDREKRGARPRPHTRLKRSSHPSERQGCAPAWLKRAARPILPRRRARRCVARRVYHQHSVVWLEFCSDRGGGDAFAPGKTEHEKKEPMAAHLGYAQADCVGKTAPTRLSVATTHKIGESRDTFNRRSPAGPRIAPRARNTPTCGMRCGR